MEAKTLSRLVDAPIEVTLGPDGTGDLVPVTFRYRRERHQVKEIPDAWVMTWQWWQDAGAVARAPGEAHFFLVETTKGGVFELVREPGGEWRMWKVYD